MFRITKQETDKNGMTLNDLGAFVTDADHAGIPGDTVVTGRVKGFRQRIAELVVEA